MALPCRRGLRLSLLSPRRHASTWARHSAFPSFFSHAPIPRFALRRKALWLIPLAGGLTLYLAPRPKSLFPSIFSSPTLIPCPSPTPASNLPLSPTIFSPSESDRNIVRRILALLRDRIWEPILTAKRFIYLFALFMPVIICSPMLLIGNPEKRYRGDRWGAVWWYGLLVSKMEAAGPTFIKVRPYAMPSCPAVNRLHSWHSGQPLEQISSHHSFASVLAHCTLKENRMLWNIPRKSSREYSSGRLRTSLKSLMILPSEQAPLLKYVKLYSSQIHALISLPGVPGYSKTKPHTTLISRPPAF